MLTNEEVIAELLKMAKEINNARKEGDDLGLTEEEMAFYDALTKPEAIHGHDHNGVEPYKEGCNHMNLAANVCGYTPLNLGKIIKSGVLSNIQSIHRTTIDGAVERKKHREERERL